MQAMASVEVTYTTISADVSMLFRNFKGALNPNFLNLTINRAKFLL